MNIFQQREQILADLIEAYREHDEEKTDNLLDQLKDPDKPAEQEKPLPEEPKEHGFYVTANNDRLLLKDDDDDWSARTYDNNSVPNFWKSSNNYVKWQTVCETRPPEAFPLKRLNTGDDDND